MVGKKWTEQEDRIISQEYPNNPAHKVAKKLGRSVSSVWGRAKRLGIVKRYGYSRVGSIEPLLQETTEAYYWAGFIAADGSFSEGNRLKVVVSIVDLAHLKKLAKMLQTDVHIFTYRNGRDYCFISIRDSLLVPKLCEKFDYKPSKTYHPPTITIDNSDLFLSFFTGFVDGDGSITYVHGRDDAYLRVKIHSSWLKTLSKMEQDIYQLFGFEYKKLTKTNSSGYACLNISNNTLLRKLKKKIENLSIPYLRRKWDRIDCNKISRYEVAKHNKNNVINLYKQGITKPAIAKQLGMNYTTVYKIIMRS